LGDGSAVGLNDAALLGEELGCADGSGDGSAEGFDDAALLGEKLGSANGLGDGKAEGLDDVALDGCGVGCADGSGDGSAERLDDVDDCRVEGLDDGTGLFRIGAFVGLIEMMGDTVVETGGMDGFFVGEVLTALEVDGPLAEFDVSEYDDGTCDGAGNCCKVGFGDGPEEEGWIEIEVEGFLVIN